MNTVGLIAAAVTATNVVSELPPVVVYATRNEAQKQDVPSAVQIYDADAIETSGARDLPELLRKKAFLDVRQLSGNPMQSAVYMRGFGENGFGRTKILIDGEELNNADMAAPNMMRIPLWSTERIEIIHGPSPVLYGDGAIAGVIRATTDTRDYDKRTRISARGGSYGTFGANFSSKGGFEEEGLLYSGTYDYLRSDGYCSRSAYDMHAADAGLRKNFENGSTAAIKVNYRNASYELPGSLPYEQWKANKSCANTHYDWSSIWSYGAGFDTKARIADDQWLYFDGWYSHQHRRSNWGDYDYRNDYSLRSANLSPRYVNEMPAMGLESRLTAGLDLRYDYDGITDRSSRAMRMPVYSYYHFERYRSAGFLHEELWLTEELSIVAGARLENINNKWSRYQGLSESRRSEWMGDFELGLVYRPVEGLKTYAKGTRFHRSPFCDEMNYTRDGWLLKPETGESLDVGVEWEFIEEFTLEANAYGMLIDDEIFYNPYASRGAYGWNGYNENSPGRTCRYGFDAGLSWLRDKVAEASVKYSLVQAEFCSGQYNGNDVPLVPNHRVRAEAGVWIMDDLKLKGGFSFVGSQRISSDYDNVHEKLPWYPLFDVGVLYSPYWAEGWKASLVVDNLLGRKYCDFAGWSDWSGAYCYPACGRSFLITVSYEF